MKNIEVFSFQNVIHEVHELQIVITRKTNLKKNFQNFLVIMKECFLIIAKFYNFNKRNFNKRNFIKLKIKHYAIVT